MWWVHAWVQCGGSYAVGNPVIVSVCAVSHIDTCVWYALLTLGMGMASHADTVYGRYTETVCGMSC